MNSRTVCLLGILFLGCSGAFAQTAPRTATNASQQSEPTPGHVSHVRLEVEPRAISIELNKTVTFDLIAHNDLITPVIQAYVSFVAPPGIEVTVPLNDPRTTSGDLRWEVSVKLVDASLHAEDVVFEVHYQTKDNSAKIEMVDAKITQEDVPDVAATLKTLISPAENAIDQFNDLAIFVQVQNTGSRNVELGQLRVLSPAYVEIEAPAPVQKIRAGESAIVPIRLKTAEKVVPGTYTLLLGYTVSSDGSVKTEDATAQAKVTVGIPGVSDVMQVLGVSSFLLLPGVLSVIAFLMFFRSFNAKAEWDWKSPPLVLTAVSLSLLYAFFYPVLVFHFWGINATNYLHGYNVRDAVWLWGGSILLGMVAAILAGFASYLWRLLKRRLIEPQIDDAPIAILLKLAVRAADFNLDRLCRRLSVSAAEGAEVVLALPFEAAPTGSRWVTGRAIISKAPATKSDFFEKIQQQLTTAPPHKLNFGLYRQIRSALIRREIEIRWHDDLGPHVVVSANYATAGKNVPQQDPILAWS